MQLETFTKILPLCVWDLMVYIVETYFQVLALNVLIKNFLKSLNPEFR